VERVEVFGVRRVPESVERRIQDRGKYVCRRRRSAARRTRGARATTVSATVDDINPSAGGGIVSDHVYRLTEVVGSSETSVADAIRTAVRKAAQTVRNIEWFEAKEIRGQVVDGEVAYFQVTVKLGFRVD
jgi:flavin-binding protein dodecin